MTRVTVFDIETTGRSPWSAKLLRAGIGSVSHRLPAARRKMHALMKRPGVIVEQGLFDARWALLDGAVLGDDTQIHDLMTMAWLLDEEQPLDLASLMLRYCGTEVVKPIVQRANVPVWSTAVWPLDGDDRAYVPLDEVPDPVMDEYSGNDLDEERDLYQVLVDQLEREGLWELFLRDEVPLARLLVEIEATGIPFALDANEELRDRVAREASKLESEIHASVGAPIKLSSTKQVGEYMFLKGDVELKGVLKLDPEVIKEIPKDERVAEVQIDAPDGFVVESVGRLWARGHYTLQGRGLNAPAPKKASGHNAINRINEGKSLSAKREWSTSSTDLVMENVDDEFVQDLVTWRELDKLGGYLDKYPTFVHNDRLYGHINRTGTVTGRFSSSAPNLQQIPAHGRFGAEVRGLFRGDLVVADYSQLENRIVAHFSQDAGLLKAYTDHIDLYALAASILFGGEPVKDHEYRGLLKTTILSLQYGAGFAKLGMLMTRGGHETDLHGAKALVMRLRREAFPDMFAWRDETAARAVQDGVVTTISGRRRRFQFDADWPARRAKMFPDLVYQDVEDKGRSAKRYRQRERPTDRDYQQLTMERQAINARVSGSAADICAAAMVEAARQCEGDEYRTLVQVHDEVLWERGRDWQGDASLLKLKIAGETGHGYVLENVALEFEPAAISDWSQKGVTQTGEGHVVKDRLAKARSEGMQARKASDFAADRRAMRHDAERDAAERDAQSAGSGDDKGAARARIAARRLDRKERQRGGVQ